MARLQLFAAAIQGTTLRERRRYFRGRVPGASANGFEEGKRSDIADRAADFDNGDVLAHGRHFFHRVLDLVGDVRNYLHRLAEIVAAALLGDDLLVDTPRGQIVVAGQASVVERS